MRSVVVDAARAAVDLFRWSPGWRGRWGAVRAMLRYAAAPAGSEPEAVQIAVGQARFSVRPGRAEIGTVREVWLDRVYERWPGFSGEPGWTVVDVGAHIGTYTVQQALRVGPRGLVIAVEPNPGARAQLQGHVRLNRLTNVTVVSQAMADRSGTERFAVSVRSPMVSRILHPWEPAPPAGWTAMDVAATTLDDLCGRLGLDRIDLLKIDVEQAELRVMAGAPRTLARTRRLVVECLGDTRVIVRDQLRALGFDHVGTFGTVGYYARAGA